MPGSDLIQSLATGMDVLVLLAEAEHGLRVKDVAEKAGISSPVAHNVLRTLRAKGFVERDARVPVYRLGPRVFELFGCQESLDSLQHVEAGMVALLEVLPDTTVTFSRPLHGEIVVVRRLNAQNYGVVQKPSGFSLGLYSSASGLAALAFCSEDCYLTLQQHHPFLDEGAQIWSPHDSFDRCLEEVRRQGYAVHPYIDDKRLAVACPVFTDNHQLTGLLGICRTAPRDRSFEDNDLSLTIEHLRRAAQEIEAKQTKA